MFLDFKESLIYFKNSFKMKRSSFANLSFILSIITMISLCLIILISSKPEVTYVGLIAIISSLTCIALGKFIGEYCPKIYQISDIKEGKIFNIIGGINNTLDSLENKIIFIRFQNEEEIYTVYFKDSYIDDQNNINNHMLFCKKGLSFHRIMK